MKKLRFLKSLFNTKKNFSYEGTNAPLVQAMNRMASRDNTENRKNLYEALLASTLIIPTPELPEEFRIAGEKAAGSNTRIDIVGFNDKQGRKITPAFTDIDALKTWDPNTPSLGLKAQALFRMVLGTDFQALVINPFDPIRKMLRPGGWVTRAELELLANGIMPMRIRQKGFQFQLKTNQKIAIGIPALRPSPEVEETLRVTASAIPEVFELYLFQMATPEGYCQSVIGIQLDGSSTRENQDDLAAKLGEAAQLKLEKGQSLDFLILRGNMGRDVRAQGLLIFQRP